MKLAHRLASLLNNKLLVFFLLPSYVLIRPVFINLDISIEIFESYLFSSLIGVILDTEAIN